MKSLMLKMKERLIRFWYAQNYAYCMSNAYLSSQRGDSVSAGYWQTKAGEWDLMVWRMDRSLR